MRLHPLVLGLLALGAGCGPRADAPDVLLVTLDTFRADHLGVAGYPRATTPRLDALAASGLRLEACRAPMSTTLPSHLSLFTGTHPLRHGVLANLSGDRVFERDPSLATVPEAFAGAGYATAAFVSAFVLRPEAGLDAGFTRYDAPEGAQRSGRETVDRALAWWSRHQGAPRFLWVHLFDPHLPHEPPAETQVQFQGDQQAPEILAARGIPARPELIAHLNGYDRELLHTDALVGELLDAAGRQAVVLVVGDHGEGLWQHGWEAHGYLWDEQLRVPALLRAPGVAPGCDPNPCALMDLAPRLLSQVPALARSPVARAVTGQSQLTRVTLGAGHLALATAERAQVHALERAGWSEGPWSLIRRVPRSTPDAVEYDLFHLDEDPGQERNRAATEPAVVRRLEERLLRTAADLLEGTEPRVRAATGEERAHLEALGYGGD
jgi:choline-sulfatase